MTEENAPPPKPPKTLNYLQEKRIELLKKKSGYLSFSDYLADWPDADLADPQTVSEQMQQQANLLNKLSQYLLIRGNNKSYAVAFKAQRMLHQSLEFILPASGNDSNSPKN